MNPNAIKLLSSLVMMLGLISGAFAASTPDVEVKTVDATIPVTQQPLVVQNASLNQEENTTSPKKVVVATEVNATTVSPMPLVQPINENNATSAKVETTKENNVTIVQPAVVQTTEITHDDTATFVKGSLWHRENFHSQSQDDTATFVKALQEALADQNYDRVEEILLKNHYMIDPKTFHVSPYQAYRIGEIYYLTLRSK
ncbi:MAG: hypothetical protein WA080_10675 [Sulfuricurvum sp.]